MVNKLLLRKGGLWGRIVVFIIIGILFLSTTHNLLAQLVAKTPSINNIQGLAWSPDGTVLAMAGIIANETGIWLTNTNTGSISQLETPESIFNFLAVAWSPDGSKIAALASGEIYTYYIWDIPTAQLIASVEQPGETNDFSIYWSPDGSKIATVSGYAVLVRNGTTGEILTTLREVVSNTDIIQAVAWTSGGKNLLVASNNNIIRVWDVKTATKAKEISISQPISSIALSPDGLDLAVGSHNGVIIIMDIRTGKPRHVLQNPTDQSISFVKWNPNERQLASADSRGNITIWNINTYKLDSTLTGHSDEILQALVYSPYGGRLAYSSRLTGAAEPESGLSAENPTNTFANGTVKIVVPAPSLEQLQSIATACNAPIAVEKSLPTSNTKEQLSSFVMSVESLPANAIPPGCAADLTAVAEALQAEQ